MYTSPCLLSKRGYEGTPEGIDIGFFALNLPASLLSYYTIGCFLVILATGNLMDVILEAVGSKSTTFFNLGSYNFRSVSSAQQALPILIRI